MFMPPLNAYKIEIIYIIVLMLFVLLLSMLFGSVRIKYHKHLS